MLSISHTQEWRSAHPGALIGLLELSGVENNGTSQALNDRKREVEERLHSRYRGFARPDLLALPVLSAYDRYYRRFNKTYHVLLQLESIVLKGRPLPDVSPLVDANFAAEVETLVLTAGHDVARLIEPVGIDLSREEDRMTRMNGETRAIRPGDMIMRDGEGVSCSIIYGQDDRSPIAAATTAVLYVAYAPDGVPEEHVELQLRATEENVRLFAPGAVVEQHRILAA